MVFSHIQKFCRCLSIHRCIFIPFYSSLLFFTMKVDNAFLFHASFSTFRTTNFGVVFSKEVLPYARKQSFTKHKIPCRLDVSFCSRLLLIIFSIKALLIKKWSTAMMAADSCFLVAPLKRFLHEAKSNWDMALKHLLQSLQFLAQSASEPFPLVINGCCLQCLFSFLLSFFVGFVIGSINRCQWSSQSARRRRLVDQ